MATVGGDTLSGAGSGALTGATLGSVVPVLGTAAGAVIGGVAGAVGGFLKGNKRRRDQKNLNKLINNAPKYKINDEAYQNQAIARSQAFGRDRSIMGQEQALDQDASNSIAAAKDVTSSSSALLSTIAAINANKDEARRGLATTEAGLQNQKINNLYNVNNQLIDEKDKEWNYNNNMPYQMKVGALRDRIKFGEEQSAQDGALFQNALLNTAGTFGNTDGVVKKRKGAWVTGEAA